MILVTGATGFVGSHLLLRLLELGRPVTALYRNNHALQTVRELFASYQKEALFENTNWIEADLIDVPSLEYVFKGIDIVYHCAASISFDPKDENLLRKVNIEGTANVVNFCLDYKVRKLCYVSSIAALGDLKEGEHTITEETEWNPEKPHSDYAISKYGAEMEVWRGQQEGLETIVVNPGVILGPGFWNSGSGEIFNRVANGLSFHTSGQTGFTTVTDVVEIMIQLTESDLSGERFTIVSQNRTFKEILQLIAKGLGVRGPMTTAKPWMTSVAWRLDAVAGWFGKRRTLSRGMARSLHHTNRFSNQKISKALDYQFGDLDAYILQTAARYLKKK